MSKKLHILGSSTLDGYRTAPISIGPATHEDQVDPEIEEVRSAVRIANAPEELRGVIDRISSLQRRRISKVMEELGIDISGKRNKRKAISAAIVELWRREHPGKSEPETTELLTITDNIVEGLVTVPPYHGEQAPGASDTVQDQGGRSIYLDKSTLIENMLREIGIKAAIRHAGSDAMPNRANQSYKVLYIPKLRVGIVYCDAYAQQSFVLYDLSSNEAVQALSMNKQELLQLQVDGRCTPVIWNSNTEQWQETLETVITNQPSDLPEPCQLKPEEVKEAARLGIEEYLKHPKFARHDVDQLLKACETQQWDRSYSRIERTHVVCADGIYRSGDQILHAATRAFNTATTVVESRKKEARNAAWPQVLKIAGYIVQDLEYMHTKDFIYHDLGEFVRILGVDSINRLTPTSGARDKAECSDGRSYTWTSYIESVAKILGITKTTRETAEPGKRREALIALLDILGEKLEEFAEMDNAYFEKNLRADLEVYVAICEDVTTIDELTMTRMRNAPKARCANGEMVNGLTYLARAGRAILGLKRGEDANNTGPTLALLKEEATTSDSL